MKKENYDDFIHSRGGLEMKNCKEFFLIFFLFTIFGSATGCSSVW